MRVHLVDGTYELFRAYYGAPGRTDADGVEIGATRGLLSSLVSLLMAEGATHVAVAFDHVIESFRNDLFDGYKTGDGIEPQLLAQFDLAEAASRALGVVVWPMVEFEADDALASAATRYAGEQEVEQVVLCSPDKDLAQCVEGSRIVTWDRMRSKVYDEPAVLAKFGVLPSSIPDYLALVGDAADGIPGVPRWGAKSTAQVLREYGSLERAVESRDEWTARVRGGATLAGNLCERLEEARLYRKLATLRRDVPLAESVHDLRYDGPVVDELVPLLDRFGAKDLLARISGHRG